MEMQEALLNLKDLESIYYIDMVMVIDATMDSPFINNIKFWQDLIIQTDSMISQCMKQYGRQSRIRLKIIYFRDYYFDGKYAAGESEAFEIPNDRNQVFVFLTTSMHNSKPQRFQTRSRICWEENSNRDSKV